MKWGLSLCVSHQLRIWRRKNIFFLFLVRAQAGCHKQKPQGFLLCNQPGSHCSGRIYHLLPKCNCFRQNTYSGRRQWKEGRNWKTGREILSRWNCRKSQPDHWAGMESAVYAGNDNWSSHRKRSYRVSPEKEAEFPVEAGNFFHRTFIQQSCRLGRKHPDRRQLLFCLYLIWQYINP